MTKLGPGFAIDPKTGKVVRVVSRHLDTSARIRQRKSKKVKPVRRGTITHGKSG